MKDVDGKDWDIKMAGGFRLQFIKDSKAPRDGILLQMVQIMTDSVPVIMRLMGRGLMKPADPGL